MQLVTTSEPFVVKSRYASFKVRRLDRDSEGGNLSIATLVNTVNMVDRPELVAGFGEGLEAVVSAWRTDDIGVRVSLVSPSLDKCVRPCRK